MCLSAEVDLVAGVAVGSIALDACRHVRKPSEKALAALPLLLAGHQLVESLVWFGLEGRVAASVAHSAAWLYLAIAFGVLPVLVPIAVGAMEPGTGPRRVRPFLAVGIGVAIMLMYPVARGPIDVSIRDYHVAYQVDLWQGGLLVALYILVTCGAMLTSKIDYVRWFGAANLMVAIALTWATKTGFISLWCLWAAVTSVGIALHLRRSESWSQLAAGPMQ